MKKHHWHALWYEKLFEKHSQPHCQTRSLFANLKNKIKISYARKYGMVGPCAWVYLYGSDKLGHPNQHS